MNLSSRPSRSREFRNDGIGVTACRVGWVGKVVVT